MRRGHADVLVHVEPDHVGPRHVVEARQRVEERELRVPAGEHHVRAATFVDGLPYGRRRIRGRLDAEFRGRREHAHLEVLDPKS